MPTKKEKIIETTIKLLEQNPSGLRYMQLVNAIKEKMPEMQMNTIHGTVWDLEQKFPKVVYKPQRGLFRHTQFKNQNSVIRDEEIVIEEKRIMEEDFYKPFVNYRVRPSKQDPDMFYVNKYLRLVETDLFD